jgi:hypothetical protein
MLRRRSFVPAAAPASSIARSTPSVPAHNLIYVGGLFQYDQYRDLRLAKNLAAEDLQDAKLNAEDEMGWEVWGPPY